jgi:hypothetical protein
MIVDAGLGRGSGVAAVDEILRAGPIAHLFISGDAVRVQARKPGAVVVRKPFHEAELARQQSTSRSLLGPDIVMRRRGARRKRASKFDLLCWSD